MTDQDNTPSLKDILLDRASNAELNPFKVWANHKARQAEACRNNPNLKQATEHYELAKAEVDRAKALLKVPIKARGLCDQIDGLSDFLRELGYTNAADDVQQAKVIINEAITRD